MAHGSAGVVATEGCTCDVRHAVIHLGQAGGGLVGKREERARSGAPVELQLHEAREVLSWRRVDLVSTDALTHASFRSPFGMPWLLKGQVSHTLTVPGRGRSSGRPKIRAVGGMQQIIYDDDGLLGSGCGSWAVWGATSWRR